MSTEPDQIRAQVSALLANLPDASTLQAGTEIDLDAVAARLAEAHDVLVSALESVEKG